uniref:Sec20 C-terminal domain-containing protein n=1 Tax=Kalanchoe fedtschenkoi TaxID=63787 RepID=A0A7N0TS40_KALFE
MDLLREGLVDKVAEAVNKVKKDWGETFVRVEGNIKSIEECGKAGRPADDNTSLLRLNRLVQDGLSTLSSLQFQLDLLAPQLPSYNEVEVAQSLLESWKNQLHSLRVNWKKANLQAKDNMRKAAQKEELLLGSGEESTIRRRNLQTKAGMTTAAESITDSFRRTRQLMVQEIERNANALMTVVESTTILKKAESEYKGHRSLLMRTRDLLSTMQRQDVRQGDPHCWISTFLMCCSVCGLKTHGIAEVTENGNNSHKSWHGQET